jgi:glyoxylase-like metal-dependent hydrolase (beta-lactamase superfamily II)
VLESAAAGVWRWTARHPEWHPGAFGAEVAAWAVRQGGGTVLIDPILPAGAAEALDAVVEGEVAIAITIPYHARDSEAAAARWAAPILGHRAVAKRLGSTAAFRAVAPGDDLPLGLSLHRIGNPRRQEAPVLLADAGALAVGDAVVGVDGGLRVWVQGDRDERWYRERLIPSLEPLLELDFDRVLTTHGAPVLSGGRDALAAAFAAPPWQLAG